MFTIYCEKDTIQNNFLLPSDPPEMIRGQGETEFKILQGSTLTLGCKTDGFPKPKVGMSLLRSRVSRVKGNSDLYFENFSKCWDIRLHLLG